MAMLSGAPCRFLKEPNCQSLFCGAENQTCTSTQAHVPSEQRNEHALVETGLPPVLFFLRETKKKKKNPNFTRSYDACMHVYLHTRVIHTYMQFSEKRGNNAQTKPWARDGWGWGWGTRKKLNTRRGGGGGRDPLIFSVWMGSRQTLVLFYVYHTRGRSSNMKNANLPFFEENVHKARTDLSPPSDWHMSLTNQHLHRNMPP